MNITPALAGIALLALSGFAVQAEEALKIGPDTSSVTIQTEDGPVEITRHRNDTQLIGGVLQPIIRCRAFSRPASEVLEALQDDTALVVDMRTMDWRVKSTIPGSIHIPYTEVAMRLDELGCTGKPAPGTAAMRCPSSPLQWPGLRQSPLAIAAMVREGFPAEKIHYYRGGMQDWTVLGLTTVENLF
ncbi:MAG: rhodanese-like domain-containing protein [Alphaproteobacteria bacterium]|nr:rhodanese-like domain-containing protein [Alphaproteobacteria bacterium]